MSFWLNFFLDTALAGDERFDWQLAAAGDASANYRMFSWREEFFLWRVIKLEMLIKNWSLLSVFFLR
jgi:hypothetical protein